MKRFKLIFFMSLMLILILGTTSQANISQEYIEYTFTHFKNTISNALSDYTSEVKTTLNTLTKQDYIFYTTYINQVLKENNLQNLTNHNMTIFISRFSSTITTQILFVFSNTSSPNNVENLNYIKLKPETGNKIILRGNETNGHIYILELRISNTNHNIFQPLEVLNGNTGGKIIYYVKSTSLNSNNTILTISNVACTNTQSIYYNVPFSTSETTINTPGFISGLSAENDPGYFEIQTPQPPQPSGDVGTGGTTGTITNPSGDTTGKVDLSGIEQGIGAVKDAVNNVTNTIKDAFIFDSGDANEVMEDFKNTDLGLSQDLYDLNNQFFDLFETQEMNDFVISWNGVNYQDVELIPSGEVNFSALCRENEQIGKVKGYITLFAIVGASLTLLKVIWNMISEMLGLNQTLMETDFGDAKMYTYEDNSYDVDTRAYLDSKRYNRRR